MFNNVYPKVRLDLILYLAEKISFNIDCEICSNIRHEIYSQHVGLTAQYQMIKKEVSFNV